MIPNYAITRVSLKRIIFSDIVNMTISTLGINILDNVELFRLSNIERLLLGRFAIAYFTNVSRFQLINVSSPGFPQSSFFEIVNIHNFVIDGCKIGELMPHAITISNGTSMIIKNTSIATMNNASMIIRNFDQVQMFGSRVSFWKENGVGLQNIGQIKIVENGLENVSKGFLYVAGAAEAIINRNRFGVLGTGAMDDMISVSTVSFIGNTIETAKPESIGRLFDNGNQSFGNVVTDNTWTCGCNVEWLVLRMTNNGDFMKDNVCFSPNSRRRIRLSELSFIENNSGKCIAFVEKDWPPVTRRKGEFVSGDGGGKDEGSNSSIVVEDENDGDGPRQSRGTMTSLQGRHWHLILSAVLMTTMHLTSH